MQKPSALHEQIVRRHRLRHRHAVLQPFAQREHLAERPRRRGVLHAVFRRERKHVRVVSAEHRDIRYARVCLGDALYVREHGVVGVIEVPLPHAETGVVAHHREQHRQHYDHDEHGHEHAQERLPFAALFGFFAPLARDEHGALRPSVHIAERRFLFRVSVHTSPSPAAGRGRFSAFSLLSSDLSQSAS